MVTPTEMDAPKAYAFVMDRWTPATIPMKRLAQYLEKMSALLGCQNHVHFKKIIKGSARQILDVDEVAAVEVANNLRAANDGTWADGVKCRKEINRMLMADSQVGYLRVVHGPKIMEFLGRNTPIAQEVMVHEVGELDGVVILVGGKDATVPVHLKGADGDYYNCNTTKAIAKQLAQLIFDKQVRVTGKGTWRRDPEGVWNMEAFQITEFIEWDDVSLQDFVNEMRSVLGSGWNAMEDPHAELKRIRGD